MRSALFKWKTIISNDYYDDEDKTIKLQSIYTSFSGICADLLLRPFIP